MFSSPSDLKLRFVHCINHHKSGNAGNANNVVQEFALCPVQQCAIVIDLTY